MTTGSTRVTGDGVVGISGKPFRVTCIIVRSVTGAAVVNVRNGAAVSSTIHDVIDVTAANLTVVRDYGSNGILLSGGCYIDVDANTSFVVVEGRAEL